MLEIDDEVTATVTCTTPGKFAVQLAKTAADGSSVPVFKGRAVIELRPYGPAGDAPRPDHPLLPPIAPAEPEAEPSEAPDTAYAWTWPVPYYYGQWSEVAAASAFVGTLEEGVAPVPG